MDQLSKMIDAARMYYEYDYSQQEIAKKLEMSRPTVSRILKKAKQEGIVEVTIHDPSEEIEQQTLALKKTYELKEVIIVHSDEEETTLKEKLGEAAASFLDHHIESQDTLAASWGTTLYETAKRVQPKTMPTVEIVQLNGGASHSGNQTYATEIIHLLGRAFQTDNWLLPLPAIVDHVSVKNAIEKDRHIQRILQKGKTADKAIFSVGAPTIDSVLMQTDYFTEDELNKLDTDAAGEICSRFFNEEGHICHEELNERTIGIELDELKKKKSSILVAGGQKKQRAVRGALQGGYANILITDQNTAHWLLQS
ncbi:deoxyribonucleoside regulator [Salibacterium salarium]|uniref:sugar-binding transcriptional regulator n=1 Tax=Salibacterium salarium TaxID=284579 RepID=UPI00277D8435|nr:sugar-binding transcriptional regulator [Salibacterium salarium]MDQ0300026.1 deoxyribonucleoside regulator [Salibacterium salarium]